MISLLYYSAIGTLSLVGTVFVALCLTSGVGWIVLKALRREYDFEDTLTFGIVPVLLLIFVILMVALGAALTGNA